MSEILSEVDLFGFPVILRDLGPGRPAHVRTEANASKISLLFALGRSVADAATALGITQPTLRKHYFSEVSQREAMLLRLEADQLLRLHEQAQVGNVPAMKELLGRVDKASLAKLAVHLPDRMARAERKGKKQEQSEAAHAVGGLYEPDAPPSLSLN